MSTVVDHLRADIRVRVRAPFRDAHGRRHAVGEVGVIRSLRLDWPERCIKIHWEVGGRPEELAFRLDATEGPRSGHMRDFFALEGDVPHPDYTPEGRRQRRREELRRAVPDVAEDPIADPEAHEAAVKRIWALAHRRRFSEAEEQIRIVLSHRTPRGGRLEQTAEDLVRLAEAYADAGDPVVYDWLRTRAIGLWYAWGSQATSGGEGAAMSVKIRAAEARLPALRAET